MPEHLTSNPILYGVVIAPSESAKDKVPVNPQSASKGLNVKTFVDAMKSANVGSAL